MGTKTEEPNFAGKVAGDVAGTVFPMTQISFPTNSKFFLLLRPKLPKQEAKESSSLPLLPTLLKQ